MYPYREYVETGGLLSYAPSSIDRFRSTAIYVDKILRGADLPVEQPTKFGFVLNLKTANALPRCSASNARSSRRGDRVR